MQNSNPTSPANPHCELGRCDGSGWITSKDGKSVSECRCAFNRRIRSLVPLRFRQASLPDFPAPLVQHIEAWLSKPTDGLLIFGETGTGKTHLAAALIMLLARASRAAAFLPAATFFREVRETMRENRSESALLETFMASEFLCIDDIGSGALSGFERRILLEILERRLNELRPTIVTSNWDLGMIAEEMDQRIASRLSGFVQIELKGEDRRPRR
jgi:DNA replication protein DnaC